MLCVGRLRRHVVVAHCPPPTSRVNVTSGEARGGCQLADCEAVPVRVLMTSRGMQGNLAITASSLGLRFHASRPPGRKLLDQLIMKKSVGLLRPGAKQ